MDITSILEQQQHSLAAVAAQLNYLPVTVEKLIPVETHLQHLCLSDPNELSLLLQSPATVLSKEEEVSELLKETTRGATQLLVNALFSLPTTWSPSGVLATLPITSGKKEGDAPIVLPREKSLPKDKPMTRWERFAKAKGITTKKRSKGQVWDEQLKAFRPRYGYVRPAKDGVKPVAEDWLIEVPEGKDPLSDAYQEKRKEKATLKQKQEKRQKRNLEEAFKAGYGESSLLNQSAGDKKTAQKQITERALWLAKKSTTTLGRDSEEVKGEGVMKIKNQKRKYDPLIMSGEGDKESQIAEKVLKEQKKKKPLINTRKAINQIKPKTAKRPTKPIKKRRSAT